MPRILRIINRFNLGGPTYNVAYLTKFISPEFETLLVGGAKDETEESSEFILDSVGLKPIIIEQMKREISLMDDYRAYKKIKKIIKDFKPDIVHTHASKAGTLGRLAASSCGVPVIVHTFHGHIFHSYFGKLRTLFYKNIERYLAKKSSAIIAISRIQKDELVLEHKICEADKVHIIPLGFDLSKFQENQEEKRKAFRNKYKVDDDAIVVAIIGRLVPVKNHALFLTSLKNVSQKTKKKIRAFIVGDGEDRQIIEKKAGGLDIPFVDWNVSAEKTLLTFTSWIKEIDVVLAGCDIVALTSFNEGTPVSLIEAQAANKPIVTTRVGGVENVIISDVTALLCENNNSEDFSNKLLCLIEDDSLRERMSSGGRQFVTEKYHYSRLVNETEFLYKKLLLKEIRKGH